MIKNIVTAMIISIVSINFSAAQPNDRMGGTIEAEIDGKLIYLPQLKSDIAANIEGDLASVEITQSFANISERPMNARYLFPMNKDAAVYEMTMIIGDDITKAIIKRKEEAERTFEQAKKDGKTASLLSQHRPNMFTQKIANLMPGVPVIIKIKYTQIVPKIDGKYELVVPLVVGPRYQPAGGGIAPAVIDQGRKFGAQKSTSRSTFGTWELEELPNYPEVTGLSLPNEIDQERVSIKINVNAPMKVEYVISDTHDINVTGRNNNRRISLQKSRVIDNRDFVLKYQLSGDMTQAGFLSTMSDEGNGYFSLLIEPPALPRENQISNREMVFVLDTSGSMNGAPLEASKVFMRHTLNNLRSGDHFRIISFNSTATEYSTKPQLATLDNIKRGLTFVDNLSARGGTEIAKSITQAFTVAPKHGNIRLVTFLTDGYIGNEATILNQIAGSIGDARIFAFGVGTGVNRYLLSEMGRKGRGFARFIDPTEDMNDAAISLAARLNAPVLTDISLDFGNLEVEQLTPDVIPDLFAGDSIRIQGKFKGTGSHVIRVNGKSRGNTASLPIQVKLANFDNPQKDAISTIWARSQVADKMRHINTPDRLRTTSKTNQQLKKEVVNLGLDHSIVTKWTSFVAVSEKIANADPGTNVDGDVALPMVDGVEASAYPNLPANMVKLKKEAISLLGSRVRGRTALDSNIPVDVTQQAELAALQAPAPLPVQSFAGASAPEPAAWGGIIVLGVMGFWLLRRRKN